ncbi:MAG TPA: hypothetical protein VGG32_06120 [Thermoplasmata archaeon]|jgi:hypothetical protein
MTDGSSVPHEEGPPLFGSGPRTWILVSCLAAVAVVAIAASVAVAGVQLGSPSGVSVSRVLFFDQNKGVSALYEGQFTVPALLGPNVSVEVEEFAIVNISCGGASPYDLGTNYTCIMSLWSGPFEDIRGNQNPLWWGLFSGNVGSNVSLLPPGVYSLLVHVVIGSFEPPFFLPPFQITAEAVTLS